MNRAIKVILVPLGLAALLALAALLDLLAQPGLEAFPEEPEHPGFRVRPVNRVPQARPGLPEHLEAWVNRDRPEHLAARARAAQEANRDRAARLARAVRLGQRVSPDLLARAGFREQ